MIVLADHDITDKETVDKVVMATLDSVTDHGDDGDGPFDTALDIVFNVIEAAALSAIGPSAKKAAELAIHGESGTGKDAQSTVAKPASTPIKLAIKPNNVCCDEVCAICGNETEPQLPYAIFTVGDFDAVCNDCAAKYDPTLLQTVLRLQDEFESDCEAKNAEFNAEHAPTTALYLSGFKAKPI